MSQGWGGEEGGVGPSGGRRGLEREDVGLEQGAEGRGEADAWGLVPGVEVDEEAVPEAVEDEVGFFLPLFLQERGEDLGWGFAEGRDEREVGPVLRGEEGEDRLLYPGRFQEAVEAFDELGFVVGGLDPAEVVAYEAEEVPVGKGEEVGGEAVYVSSSSLHSSIW